MKSSEEVQDATEVGVGSCRNADSSDRIGRPEIRVSADGRPKRCPAGIQEAVEDAVKDRAFDATHGTVRSEANTARQATFGENAGAAVESAMTAADVAATLDKASDAVEAAQKVNRARKVVKTIKR